jgi:hypothetical protein
MAIAGRLFGALDGGRRMWTAGRALRWSSRSSDSEGSRLGALTRRRPRRAGRRQRGAVFGPAAAPEATSPAPAEHRRQHPQSTVASTRRAPSPAPAEHRRQHPQSTVASSREAVTAERCGLRARRDAGTNVAGNCEGVVWTSAADLPRVRTDGFAPPAARATGAESVREARAFGRPSGRSGAGHTADDRWAAQGGHPRGLTERRRGNGSRARILGSGQCGPRQAATPPAGFFGARPVAEPTWSESGQRVAERSPFGSSRAMSLGGVPSGTTAGGVVGG